MILFKDVQTKVKDLLAAGSYFSGQTVIADAGDSEPAAEQALRERGICLIVLPIISARRIDHGKAIVTAQVDVAVQLLFNPIVNAAHAQKGIGESISASFSYVLAWQNPKMPQDRFNAGEQPVQLIDIDEGLVAYGLFFEKLCIL
jgi:hypothetical protein